ncbi:MAG: hypothetical protein HY595_04685 [Candidatus Omnitrophica bacterium]|nr:hypothetical protein [Candidatus Omnitrophota bacterium]
MIRKNHLKTIRLSRTDQRVVTRLLEQHPHLGTFSNLVRASLWNFLNGGVRGSQRDAGRPSFLWEYPLTRGEFLEMVSGPREKRLWLVAKILEHGRWEEIWEYLTVAQIEADLPYLRLPHNTKAHWRFALSRWRRSPWRS